MSNGQVTAGGQKQRPSVPMSEWGRDHWSTLAYLETRVVDYKGKINNNQMRCNPHRHAALLGRLTHSVMRSWVPEYGTRLQGHTAESPRRVDEHDDWDCLNDMVSVGLVEVTQQEFSIDSGCAAVAVQLTDRGWSLAHQLRRYLGHGGSTGTFQPAEAGG